MPSNGTASAELTVRTYRASDFDQVHALVNASGLRMTRSGLADHLDSPMLTAEHDVFVIEQREHSAIAGIRDVRVTGRGDEASPIFESWGATRVDAPPRAFEVLLQAGIGRAGERLDEGGATIGTLQTRCGVDDLNTRAALEANGLSSVRELWGIERRTLDELPEPHFPAHIHVREYRVGQDESAWVAAFNNAFADHFGGWMGMSASVWERYVRSSTFKPEISLVAWDGEQIAGFGHFRIDDELNALRQRRQAGMRYIGVRPMWRRQGLARALTRAGLLAVRRAGMESVVSGVDGTNGTGAHLLYLDEGFEVSGRELLYRIQVPR